MSCTPQVLMRSVFSFCVVLLIISRKLNVCDMPELQADIHKKSRDIRNLLLLLVHNQIAVAQLVRDGLLHPDISKSPPIAYAMQRCP